MWFRLSISFLLFGFLLDQSSSAQEKKTVVAFSLRAAQQQMEIAVREGRDFRSNRPDLFYLGGITNPRAILLDRTTGDWILFGERDPRAAILTLDDWVVALRARFNHPQEDPGVTIDPIRPPACRDDDDRSACRDIQHQAVRFFAGIDGTHFGQVCYEADWLMKRIGLALEVVPVENLKTHYALATEWAQRTRNKTTSIRSRFWFYPIVNRVNVLRDLVLLETFQMGVFSEVMYAEVDGQPVRDLDAFRYYPADEFAQSFTQAYDQLAEVRETLETLRGLTRLAALAKGLVQAESQVPFAYFLKTYPLKPVATPTTVGVLENKAAGLRLSGGVTLKALALRAQGGDIEALRNLVLGARPAKDALTWQLEIEIQNDRIANVRLPEALGVAQSVVALLSQAGFLYQKKRYDAAIEAYGKVLQSVPLPAAYYGRGAGYFHKGEYDRAISDFRQALGPGGAAVEYPEAILGLARALLEKKRAQEANAVLDQLLADRPENAPAWLVKGYVYLRLGGFPKALESFERALLARPVLVEAQYGKASALFALAEGTGRKDYVRTALGVIDEAIKANPWRLEPLLLKAYFLSAQETSPNEVLAATERALMLAEPTNEAEGLLWLLKGQAEAALGKDDQARRSVMRAMDRLQRDLPAVGSALRSFVPASW